MTASSEFRNFIVLGQLCQEFIIPVSGSPKAEIIGGNALYTAAGLGVWNETCGIVARVNEDFPLELLDKYEAKGYDLDGIHLIPDLPPQKIFYYYPDPGTCLTDNPMLYYAQAGHAFPKSLLGYSPLPNLIDNRVNSTNRTLRPPDIPAGYLDTQTAHLAPMDFLSHSLLPNYLRQGTITTLTVNPGDGYMNPSFFEEIPSVVKGLHAFSASERKIRCLFEGHTTDLMEMVETLGSYGTETVIVLLESRGQLVLDVLGKKRWMIPPYPARVVDPTGGEDAFCGGYLAGYKKTYNPLSAALYGSVAELLTVEGSGPSFPLETLTGLAEARLEMIKNQVVEL